MATGRLEPELRYLLQQRCLMTNYQDRRDELREAGAMKKDAQSQAAKEILEAAGVDLEKAVTPDGTSVLKRKSDRVDAKVFAGKSVPIGEAVHWVAEHLQIKCVAKDAPDAVAWSMLCWARKSPINQSEFWKTIFSKVMLPTAQVTEDERPFHHNPDAELPEFLRESADEGREWRESDSVKAGLR